MTSHQKISGQAMHPVQPIYVRFPLRAVRQSETAKLGSESAETLEPMEYDPFPTPVPQQIYCGAAVRLLTLSRPLAAELVMDEPYIVVSIDSPGKQVPPLAESPLCVAVLRTLFNDIRAAKEGRLLFTRQQAREILEFVGSHVPHVRAILVHCTGGLFRSPAVGAALSTILQGEERFFETFHQRNPHVYQTMIAEWEADPVPAPLCDGSAFYHPHGGERDVTAADAAITAFKKPYAWLSNYSAAPVEYEGVTYKTVEHAYQAAKTLDPAWRDKIRDKANPGWARQTGKSKSLPLRPDWDDINMGVMLELLRQKFSDPKRAAQLLSTGQRELVEGNHWGDRYWGAVLNAEGQWEGENHLGKMLMEIRAELGLKDELHPQ